MNNSNLDSLIFSVTYENYIKNINIDKPDKKLGKWSLSEQMTNHIKFAYTYLKDSDQMIVKKHYIDKFEKLDDGKYCFYFSRSEDIFFEYPHARVQARHYRNSVELENCSRLAEDEIKIRLSKSKNIRSEASTSKTKNSGIIEPAKEELVKIRNEKFKDNPLPTAEEARILIEKVKLGEDADAVVTEFYLDKENQ
tara:strand:+ start:371 stop:955 length:585 start_codon:yes stop_codon:yes gene_type:complete